MKHFKYITPQLLSFKTTLTILLILVTLLQSCDFDKPDQLTIIEGTVRDYYTNDLLDSIPIIIDECKHSGMYSEVCFDLDTLYSDSEGIFNYQFYNQRYKYYQIWTSKTDGYAPMYSDTVKEGKTNKMDIRIKPYTKLRINITVKDTASILVVYTAPTFNTNLYHDEMDVFDLTRDTTIYLKAAPEEWNFISWNSSITKKHFEWIYVDKANTDYSIILDRKSDE